MHLSRIDALDLRSEQGRRQAALDASAYRAEIQGWWIDWDEISWSFPAYGQPRVEGGSYLWPRTTANFNPAHARVYAIQASEFRRIFFSDWDD